MNIFDNHRINSFLSSQRLGVIATLSFQDKSPEVAMVYYAIDENFNIFILTSKKSRKFQNIIKNKKVAFLVGQEVDPVVIQMEGVASIVVDPDIKIKIEQKLTRLGNLNPDSLSFPPSFYLSQKNEIIQIIVNKLKYSNFSAGGNDIIEF